jgi:hypothetical protein
MKGSAKWRRAEAVLFRQALDDVVILVPGPQPALRPEPEPEPFALAGGAALWRLLEQPRTTHELVSELTAGVTVNTEPGMELDGLLTRLAEAGAVDRIPA